MNNYIGKIRLVKQPDIEHKYTNHYGDTKWTECEEQPPKLQQFDGKDWVDVEIVELPDPK